MVGGRGAGQYQKPGMRFPCRANKVQVAVILLGGSMRWKGQMLMLKHGEGCRTCTFMCKSSHCVCSPRGTDVILVTHGHAT